MEKAVVQVPIGGDLNRMVTLLSTGEYMVVILESGVIGGGYCPREAVGQWRRASKVKHNVADNAKKYCWPSQHKKPTLEAERLTIVDSPPLGQKFPR